MQELTVLTDTYDLTKMHTACHDCIFALWHDNIQFGCEANMLEKLKRKNVEPIQVYNGDKEFFVIDNFKCPSKRDEHWRNNLKAQFKANLPIENCLTIVNSQNICRFYIMIYVDSLADQLKDIQYSIDQCLHNNYGHVKYVFVCHQDRHNDVLKELKASKLANWRIETILEDCKKNRAMDIAQKKSGGYQYSGFYVSGTPINFSLLPKINDRVANLENIALVTDNEGMIIYNKIYTLLCGNYDKPFMEKLQMVIKETKEDYLIKNGDEL